MNFRVTSPFRTKSTTGSVALFLIKSAVAIISIALLSAAASGATFTVTKVADTNDGVCDADCSLREAVVAANGGAADEIEFDPVVFGTAQTITLGSSLTITGADTSVEGPGMLLLTISIANPARAFIVSGTGTAISGLRVTGGGIALTTGAGLVLTNSKIQDVAGHAEGGGVSNIGGSLTVSGSILENNQAGFGGGIHCRLGTVNVTNTLFDNNRVTDFTGGGAVHNSRCTYTITGATLTNNRNINPSIANGGAVANYGTMDISDSTISGSLALTGGAIINQSGIDDPPTVGVLSITRTTISSNVANTGLGGAIYNRSGTLTISASTINNNIAATSGGGGIAIRDFPGERASSVTITNSTISSNSTPSDGGGIYMFASSGVLNLLSNTIVYNVADSDNSGGGTGGGIFNVVGQINFRNTLIGNNSGGFSRDISGSFVSQGFNLIEVTNGGSISGTLTGNITGQDPQLLPFANYGGPTNTYGLLLSSPAIDRADPNNFPPTDQRGVARPQDGDGNGSVLPDIGSFESQLTVLTVTKVADTNDGTCDADCSLREAIQTVNAATSGLIMFDATVFANPQTIVLSLGELVISIPGTMIINGPGRNRLAISGGNQSRIFSINPGSSVSITALSVINGNGNGTASTGFGGAILNAGGSLFLNDVAVTGSTASSNGGGIFNDTGSTLSMVNCVISGNNANSGGGIHNAATLSVNSSTIATNVALSGGGGIVNAGAMTMSNSTVSGNSTTGAFGGGGIFNNSAQVSTITYSTIASNTGFPGGGVRNNSGTLNFRAVLIGNNVDPGGTPSDYAGILNSQGFNLLEDPTGATITGSTSGNVLGQDPSLGPLANNGGLTPTHLPNVGSPAVDRADTSSLPLVDQRGFPRPVDGDGNGSQVPDIGSVEIPTPPLNPLVLSVDRTDDLTVTACTGAANDCTLRGAITRANSVGSNDSIVFDPTVFGTPQTISLSGSSLPISSNGTLSINGPGPRLLTISGIPSVRVITIATGATASIGGVRLANGNGGILNSGTLILTHVAIQNNNATLEPGGGIANLGTLTMTRSLVSHNNTTIGAGGVYNIMGGATIVNSTISHNTAPFDGGIGSFAPLTLRSVTITLNSMSSTDTGNFAGGVAASTSAVVENSIIANNVTGGTSPDIRGAFTSQGYNLIGNPAGGTGFSAALNDILSPPGGAMLGVLSNNGGPTDTHALLAGSPAIDKGKSFGLTNDQRLFLRPFDNPGIPNAPGGDGADIGAFELRPRARAPFDFDGDGKTDIGIFRPSVAEWWINQSSNGQTFATQFGAATDRIVPADYTGDGKADIAVWRPGSGEWFVLRSDDFTYYSFPFGSDGDIPATADYDADGKADPAVFRPSTATWFIFRSTGGTTIEAFGAAGDIPVAADYDGDEKADIAIFRPSNGQWWLNRSTAGLIATTFGDSAVKPVPGDYTGDAKSDVAFWRPATGDWFVLRSEDFSFFSFPFGTAGDTPAPGDYDGDGLFDATVFRSSSATWYSKRTTAGVLIQQFGTAGDRPVASAFVP